MTPEQIAQIEKIVERVLQEHSNSTQQPEKHLLAILGATQLPLDQALQQLQMCGEEGWNIRIVLSDLATKVVNLETINTTFSEENILLENELTDVPSFVEGYSQIVLPALSYPIGWKAGFEVS